MGQFRATVALCFGLSLATIVMCFGCTRIVTGGYVDSPDKKFRLYGRCYGPNGPVDIDSSSRTIRLTIVANDEHETQLFRKEYRVRGSDVGWDAKWDLSNNLTVVIYDYGEGVTFQGPAANEPPRRVFRTLCYSLDLKKEVFKERKIGLGSIVTPKGGQTGGQIQK